LAIEKNIKEAKIIAKPQKTYTYRPVFFALIKMQIFYYVYINPTIVKNITLYAVIGVGYI